MKRLQLQPTSASPAPALEDDDLLAEFLLRLPPQPSTLPRVGLVCKRWRRLVTDPRFVRRFRAFHRRTPPLHGFIMRSGLFFPTQEPPDRLPPSRFWRDRWCGEPDFQYHWGVHCCRHGLVLCCRGGEEEFASEFIVVDPVTTGHRSRRRVGILQHEGAYLVASTVVSVAGGGADRRAFLVVALLAHDYETRLTASVYSSESGAWASSDSDAAVVPPSPVIPLLQPSSLVGNAIYWFLFDGEIVRFDLGRRRLSMIEQRPRPPDVPPGRPDVQVPWINLDFRSWILPAAGDGDGHGRRFCLAVLSRRSIEFWEREAELSDDDDDDDDAAAAKKWVLCRTVQLEKVLPVKLEEHAQTTMLLPLPLPLGISGFDEESNAIFVWTDDGVFMSDIESTTTMQFKKVLDRQITRCYLHPYSSV